MSLESKGFAKIKVLIIAAVILLVVLISAIFSGVQALSSKKDSIRKETFSEGRKDKKASKKKKKNKKSNSPLARISSLGDTAPASNVLGNSYVTTDGTNIFLKSQYDNSEIYSYSGGESLNLISKNTPGQMYYYKDYIYYSAAVNDKNIPGSLAIYRSKAEGSDEEMLMPFDTDTFYLVLDALAEGKLYFTFNKEVAAGKGIYQMDLDTLDVQLLHTIPADIATDFPLVNATSDGLYFKDREGLKKLNPESKEIKLVIKDFDAVYYTIYKGYVYYTQSKKGNNEENVVRRVFLDGRGDELIYTGEAPWIYDITAFVLNDKLFILSESDPDSSASYGNIHSCELDGSKPEIISDKANLVGLTDNAVYYGFTENSTATETSTAINKFETVRSIPIYKRDVSAEGNISDEYVFLDPKPLNKGWIAYNNLSIFYNPEVRGFYVQDYIYYDENGELYKNSWKNIDGKDYYFGEDGRMYSQEFTPDGYFVGLDGTVSDFIAPFKFIYSEYPKLPMTLKTDRYNDVVGEGFYKGTKNSTVIDRDGVYEITNVNIFATSTLSEEEAAPLEAGYSFYLKGNNLFCTVTEKEGYNEEFGGECIGLKQSKILDSELKLVKPEGSDKYIIKIKRSDSQVSTLSYIIYSGSVFVTKDAKLDIYKKEAPDEDPVEADFAAYNASYRETMAASGENPDEFYFNAGIVYYDTVNGTYAISKLSMYN